MAAIDSTASGSSSTTRIFLLAAGRTDRVGTVEMTTSSSSFMAASPALVGMPFFSTVAECVQEEWSLFALSRLPLCAKSDKAELGTARRPRRAFRARSAVEARGCAGREHRVDLSAQGL